jgi:Zn-dependent alcohol dehydrogenase
MGPPCGLWLSISGLYCDNRPTNCIRGSKTSGRRRPIARQPEGADVVVIGGGIVGTSALYHLVVAGRRRAVLVERATLGSGSTTAAAVGIRTQFSDELNIKIGLDSIAKFTESSR